jgi:hypothetical protein
MTSLLPFLFLALACSILGSEVPAPLTEDEVRAFDNTDSHEQSWIRRVWPKEKVDALRKFYWAYGTQNNSPLRESGVYELIQLGDEKVIDYAIRNGITPPLAWSRNPTVIPRLAPGMLSDAMIQGIHGPRAAAVDYIHAILNLLETTPEFSPNVQAWAHEGAYSTSSEQETGFAILRQWWRQNEHWFVTGEYDKVQPGAHFPPNEIPEPTPSPNEVTENHAEATPAPATPVVATPPSPMHRESAPLWALLGGAALTLTALAAIVWRSRERAK